MHQSGFFEYKVEWNEEDMLEAKTAFSNGRYSGINKTYDSAARIHAFALELMDFYTNKKPLNYELGVRNGYSYLSLNVFFAESNGAVGIRIYSEDAVSENENSETRSIIQLEIRTETEALQHFAKQLMTISANRSGTARIN